MRAMTSTSGVDSSSLVSPAGVEKVPATLDTRGRVRTTREQQRMILAEFERGGVSAAQFARQSPAHGDQNPLLGWDGSLGL
jgi:hypothetical protein